MTYKILKTNPRRNTHEFFIDEIEDLQILPKEPASTALVAATGDIYICTNDKEWVKFKKSCHGGGESDSQLSEFVVLMINPMTDELYEELPCNILADGEVVSMTKRIFTDYHGNDYPYFTGQCPAGSIIECDGENFISDSQEYNFQVYDTAEHAMYSIYWTNINNFHILEGKFIRLNNSIPSTLTVRNGVSVFSVYGMKCNLFLEYTSESESISSNVIVKINNTQQNLPTCVLYEDIIKISGNVDQAWYKIDNDEYIEIEEIMDIGYQFTVPSEEFNNITIKVNLFAQPS